MGVFNEKEQTNEQNEKLLEGMYLFGCDAQETAEEKGCYVLEPNNNELFIDLDSEQAYKVFRERFSMVTSVLLLTDNKSFWGKSSYREYPSKSGLPRRHVIVTVPNANFGVYERVALQMMLGSDFVREALNVLEITSGNKNANVFFEPKQVPATPDISNNAK